MVWDERKRRELTLPYGLYQLNVSDIIEREGFKVERGGGYVVWDERKRRELPLPYGLYQLNVSV